MASLAELAQHHTQLDDEAVAQLLRLTTSWSLLADLSFSDMVLMAPEKNQGRDLDNFIVLAQMRPNNRATLLVDDLVGTRQPGEEWPLSRQAMALGRRVTGEVAIAPGSELLPVWCVPVRSRGRVVAVMVRLQAPLRSPASLYEQAYLEIFEELCSMVSEGSFPFREVDVAGPGLPRVGDGVIKMDASGRVEFATPNATNALHRLGIYKSVEGQQLSELGLSARGIDRALSSGVPQVEEIDGGLEAAVQFHCVPLVRGETTTGLFAIVRDVSDLKLLNRQVLNKEAAVREVHHRIKNNLQTISSLLRLQSRRSEQTETIQALLEAERRVRSISIVHEVLSREPGEEVDFDEIVRSLVDLVEDSVLVPASVDLVVTGSLGTLSTDLAIPFAVALAELLTNAVEHAFSEFDGTEGRTGTVTLELGRDDLRAVAEVRDNGKGLTSDFSLEQPTSLGLSIVRDLVRTQLRGTIEMSSIDPNEGGGAVVRVVIPLAELASASS
jgi:two-component system, sensor histidine kinase PdtaS